MPEKPLLITFDDGYLDNFTNAYPVFRQLGMKANIFLVPSFIDTDTYLGVNDLKAMDPSLIEFGLHSFDHVNYRDLSKDAVLADLDKCKKSLTEKGIAFSTLPGISIWRLAQKRTSQSGIFRSTGRA